MDARERYWAMYCDIKHKERYFWHYRIDTTRVWALVTSICLLVSVPSISALILWDYAPWLWAAIAAVAQLLQFSTPYLPFTKRMTAFRYLCTQLDSLLVEISGEWNNIDIENYKDKRIMNLINQYRRRYNDIHARYMSDITLPLKARHDKRAKADCKKYFFLNYNMQEVEHG